MTLMKLSAWNITFWGVYTGGKFKTVGFCSNAPAGPKTSNEVHCVTGFVRIRHYGLLANRCKAQALRRCRQALGQPPDPPVAEPKSMAQWMQQWTGIDITCCPRCGHQPLLRTPLPVTGGTAMTRAP